MIRRNYGSYGSGLYSPTGYRATVQSRQGGAWVGGVQGSDMQSGSVHMPMARYNAILSDSPMRKGLHSPTQWAGVGKPLGAALSYTGRQAMKAGANALVPGSGTAIAAMSGQGGVAGAVAGFRPTVGVGFRPTLQGSAAPYDPPSSGFRQLSDLDANRPPSPVERQAAEPVVLPERLERFAASRTGKFLEGRVEHAADKRFGSGSYSAATGRGTKRRVSSGPPPPF
jgi:hypothetical protein